MIIEHDCDRYAMKREVAAKRSVFPWSMSDFKPGENYECFKQIASVELSV